MLFQFLKYLQPTHYFTLFNRFGETVFPVVESLPKAILESLEEDNGYLSPIATEYDLSWQVIHRGYIGDAKKITKVLSVPLEDNYRFIRKYFHAFWVFYVLILRIITFKNPYKEIKAWRDTRFTERILNLNSPFDTPSRKNSFIPLITQEPLVSVIIPTLNRYSHLKNILSDFEKQDYKNFEILIVDQSDEFVPEFYQHYNLNIRVIQQQEKALWLARNTAIKKAEGDIIALSEDDVRIMPNWISSHLDCLDLYNANVSAGVFYPENEQIPVERSYFQIASQFATGNAMLYKSVFEDVGLFDRQFEKQRMGDGEFGLRIHLRGYKCISNPKASCVDVKANDGGLREMGSWDAFRSKNWFGPRPLPSVLYFFRSYFGNKRALLALVKLVPQSVVPYKFKKNKPMLIVGGFIALVLSPLICFQVFRSWKLSTKMLKKGSLIDILN